MDTKRFLTMTLVVGLVLTGTLTGCNRVDPQATVTTPADTALATQGGDTAADTEGIPDGETFVDTDPAETETDEAQTEHSVKGIFPGATARRCRRSSLRT